MEVLILLRSCLHTHVYIRLNLREWFDVKFSLNYTPNHFKIDGIHKSLVGPHLSTCTASHCCRLVTTRPSLTTGNRQFAECLRHSAKPEIHSVKALPSAALGKEQSAKNPSAKVSLPSAIYRALGKAFAECHVSTRQKKIRRQF